MQIVIIIGQLLEKSLVAALPVTTREVFGKILPMLRASGMVFGKCASEGATPAARSFRPSQTPASVSVTADGRYEIVNSSPKKWLLSVGSAANGT